MCLGPELREKNKIKEVNMSFSIHPGPDGV